MVSHAGDFAGGAAFIFHDMVVALREKRPDLDMIAYTVLGAAGGRCRSARCRDQVCVVTLVD